MAATTVYESRVPWNPTRPDTVIISCVDWPLESADPGLTVNH